MPRFVRPVFVSVSCTDRASPVATGPRSRTGSLSALFTMRDGGHVAPAVNVHAYGTADTRESRVYVECERDATAYRPDGSAVALPKGTVVRMSAPQDAPARLISDSGFRDPATGAPMTAADVAARIRALRTSTTCRTSPRESMPRTAADVLPGDTFAPASPKAGA